MPRLNPRCVSLGTVFVLVAALASRAEGQGIDAIPLHARVRVDFPAADPSRFERSRFVGSRVQSVIGTLEGVLADTLLLMVRSSAEPLRVPRAAVHRMYLSGGRPPRWQAAFQGAFLPAVVTAALSAAGASINRRPNDPTPSEAAMSSALWVGGSSALLSAWHPKERWRRIDAAQANQR